MVWVGPEHPLGIGKLPRRDPWAKSRIADSLLKWTFSASSISMCRSNWGWSWCREIHYGHLFLFHCLPGQFVNQWVLHLYREKAKYLIGVIFDPVLAIFKFWFHSLIRGFFIQSCSAGAKNFTNYVFCHLQFGGVIQNIENLCAILTLFVCRLFSK